MTMGMGDLDTQRRGRPKSHRGETTRRDECARYRDGKLLPDTVLVPPDIGDDERILGRGFTQFTENALGTQRKLVRGPLLRPVRRKLPAAARDLFTQTATVRMLLSFGCLAQRSQRKLRIRGDAQFGWIVSAGFRQVSVDVNETRRRNRKGTTRIPRAGIRFRQASAYRHDHVGCWTRFVCDRSCPEAALAK